MENKNYKKLIIICVSIIAIFILGVILVIATNTTNISTDIGKDKEIKEEQYTTMLKDIVKIGDYIEYKPIDEEFTMTKNETGDSYDVKFETSEYKGNWRVIYNDEQNGLQIISTTGVTSRLRLSGKFGYNNSVDTLNSFCNHFANNKDFAISGRCIGSNPVSPKDNAQTEEHYSSGALKLTDENYKYDIDVINKYSLHSAGEETLLASRYSKKEGNDTVYQTYMYLRNISTSGDIKEEGELLYSVPSEEMQTMAQSISNMDMTNSHTTMSNYIRPIITLKQEVKIKGGDGTKDNPYILAK